MNHVVQDAVAKHTGWKMAGGLALVMSVATAAMNSATMGISDVAYRNIGKCYSAGMSATPPVPTYFDHFINTLESYLFNVYNINIFAVCFSFLMLFCVAWSPELGLNLNPLKWKWFRRRRDEVVVKPKSQHALMIIRFIIVLTAFVMQILFTGLAAVGPLKDMNNKFSYFAANGTTFPATCSLAKMFDAYILVWTSMACMLSIIIIGICFYVWTVAVHHKHSLSLPSV